MATGLQNIIDRCSGLTIDRRKVVGIQITRNEIPRTSLTPTKQPWRFQMEMPNSYRYNEARSLLEALDTIDRYVPQVVTFSNNSRLSWIFRYQGVMSAAQIAAITVTSFVGNQLVLGNLPVAPAGTVLFEPNDLIQIGAAGAYPYPFTVVSQVLRGTGATVSVTTHRPNILTGTLTGQTIRVGNVCEFNLFCPNMPIYKLVPGGWMQSNGITLNNAYIEFSDDFQLYEYVGSA